MRFARSRKSWLALSLALACCPLSSLAAQEANLAITITGPKDGYVDRLIDFQIQLVNKSDQASAATEIHVAPLSQEYEPVVLKVDALKPGESRSLPVALAASRVGPFDVVAYVGQRDASFVDSVLQRRRALTQVQIAFDPKAPARKFLPAAPKAQPAQPLLPSSLDEVPEAAFERAPAPSLTSWQVRNHIAGLIDKINFLSQQKSDNYMETLVKERPDLAGLPFAMGDACRLKAPAQRKAFGDTVTRLRAARREVVALERIENSPSFQRKRADKGTNLSDAIGMNWADRADIAGLMQVLGPANASARGHLVKYLSPRRNLDSTKALAKLAIFSEEESVRDAAVEALKDRPADDESTEILVKGLSYPWPEVAERASSAIAKLKRTDLIPQLKAALDRPDPRTPEVREIRGVKTYVVRELVKINHHRNCLLCHSPGTAPAVSDIVKDGLSVVSSLTAPILLPNTPFPSDDGYGDSQRSNPDTLVRIDVTYLRQDFSAMLRVPDARPWPDRQRFDFLVRSREVSAQDAAAYRDFLKLANGVRSPYHVAMTAALNELSAK